MEDKPHDLFWKWNMYKATLLIHLVRMSGKTSCHDSTSVGTFALYGVSRMLLYMLSPK